MFLAKLVIAFRALSAFLALVTFGIDAYFIKLYRDYQNLVFSWRFYVQTGVTGILTFYFIASLISFCVHRRQLKRMTYFKPRSSFHSMISLFEMLVVIGLSGGLLYVTVPALTGRNRTAFLVPFNRDSPQDDSINGDYRKYDPMNLYQCPENNNNSRDLTIPFDSELSYLCSFDRSVMSAACGVGGIAIIAAILGLIYNLTPPPQAQWANNYGEFDHPEPIPLVNSKQDV